MREVEVCPLDELEDGQARRFDLEGLRLAVVRLGETVFAIDDRCSHAEASLSEGEVDADECEIECPRHGATFDLKTGKALTLPATTPVASYPAILRDGQVVIGVD